MGWNCCNSALINLLQFRLHVSKFIYYAAANLNSGYLKCTKVVRMHYFCTIALRTSGAVLTQASRRVDLHECKVGLFPKRVIYIYLLVIFKWLLNLLKCLIYHITKDKKVCLHRVWIRLTTAYLPCAREFTQNNALALQFWCLSKGWVHLMHQNLSTHVLFCPNSLAKVNTQLLIYKQDVQLENNGPYSWQRRLIHPHSRNMSDQNDSEFFSWLFLLLEW